MLLSSIGLRTSDFHSEKTGSIPVGSTIKRKLTVTETVFFSMLFGCALVFAIISILFVFVAIYFIETLVEGTANIYRYSFSSKEDTSS